ncbi:MAG: hypothetical protein ACE5JI_13175, partial [Acidobacteriota bacterium]
MRGRLARAPAWLPDGQGEGGHLKPLGLRRVLAAVVCCWALSPTACQSPRESSAVRELGGLIERLSEPGGYFDTDNLISNETAYVQVMERLKPMGGVYLGVGPAQNFNYISRIRPTWAFIIDVRRQNMLQHLLYLAIFEKAATPYQYLCWLFSRPIREGAEHTGRPGTEALLSAFESAAPRREIFERDLHSLLQTIGRDLGVELTPEDEEVIRSIHAAFFHEQLGIRFRSHGRPRMAYHPSYRTLLTARSAKGRESHFLASPEGYGYVRKLARRGHLVPVVGDFAGPHALRAVGDFVRSLGEEVSVFYVSNVEFYLLRSGTFDAFVENIRSLPTREDSLLIRAYFNYGRAHPAGLPGHRSTLLLQYVPRFLAL